MRNIFITIGMTLIAIRLLVACSNFLTTSPTTAIDLVGYMASLDECKALGKDAGSMTVYESCAAKADLKYGRKGGSK